MREPDTADLVELGAKFDLEVTEREAERLRDTVHSLLESCDRVDDLAVNEHRGDVGVRTWSEPSEDPNNAILTICNVPPTEDHSDLLSGVTVGLKDIIAVAGIPMTAGTEVLHGFVPGTDATVVERLRAEGATIAMKTNLDEFAVCGRGTTSYTGPIRNPHDSEHTAGGSSGGSAVAVATDRVDVALGTDTGGSVRIPASFCGLIGLKPTYGLVPLTGILENTYTHDHVGTLTESVEDAARVLETLAGKDPRDPATFQAAGREDYRTGGYVAAVNDPPSVESLRVGVLDEGFGPGITDAVRTRTRTAIDGIEDAGASVQTVNVPHFDAAKALIDVLTCAEVADHWAAGGATYRRGSVVDEYYQFTLAQRARGARNQVGDFFKSKVLAGATIIDEQYGRYYTRAHAARELLIDEFEEALSDVDALVLPTTPSPAPRIEDASDPGFAYAENTRAANLTHFPALSLPNGTVDDLPVGIQLVGEPFRERSLLGVAATVEAWL